MFFSTAYWISFGITALWNIALILFRLYNQFFGGTIGHGRISPLSLIFPYLLSVGLVLTVLHLIFAFKYGKMTTVLWVMSVSLSLITLLIPILLRVFYA